MLNMTVCWIDKCVIYKLKSFKIYLYYFKFIVK